MKLKGTQNFYGVETILRESQNNNPIYLIENFIYELEKNIDILSDGKKLKIIKEWCDNSETLGKKTIVNTTNGKIIGVAKKIDGDGALILKTNKGEKRIFAGDIIHR